MSRKIDLEQNKQRKKCSCIRSLELDSSPLVWAQAAVCRRQERLQLRGEFIQLHGEGGEAVVQHVILRLGICRVTQVSEVSCSTNVTLGFMLISSFGDGRITSNSRRNKAVNRSCGDDRGLTWLPDTFRSGQSVAEDAFVPQTSEPVDDTPALVQHRALHLVLVGI